MPRAGGAEFRHSRPRQIACCKDSRQSRRAAGTGALEQPELSELLPQPCRQRLHPAPAIVGPRPPIGAGRAGGRSCAVKISNTLVGRRPPAPCSSLSSLSSRRSLAGRRLHTAPTIVGWGRPRQPDELTTLVPVAVRSRQSNPAWRYFFILTRVRQAGQRAAISARLSASSPTLLLDLGPANGRLRREGDDHWLKPRTGARHSRRSGSHRHRPRCVCRSFRSWHMSHGRLVPVFLPY